MNELEKTKGSSTIVSGGFHLNSKGIELALKVSVVIVDILLDGIDGQMLPLFRSVVVSLKLLVLGHLVLKVDKRKKSKLNEIFQGLLL